MTKGTDDLLRNVVKPFLADRICVETDVVWTIDFPGISVRDMVI